MRYLYFILIGVLLAQCSSDKVDAPDVSELDGSFNLYRLEREIMSIDTNLVESQLAELYAKYPGFMELYIQRVMGFDDPKDPQAIQKNISGFVQDSNINLMYQATQILYSDFDELSKEFSDAFRYYKHYFPDKEIPDIYTFVSEYGIQRFLFEDEKGKEALAIGVDLFLGADYPYQRMVPENPSFSQYLIRRYNKDHLVKRSMEAMVEDMMGGNKGRVLLEKMIYNGKKLYILDHLLPHASDTIIMEYTPAQLEWVRDNELEMWAYFLKEDLFYNSEINKINKLVNPSPNAPGMPPQAPGRTGNYMGWKIVEKYMEKHPEMTMSDLIAMDDAQKILTDSKFKPRK